MSTARAANLETFMTSPDKVAEPAPDTSAPAKHPSAPTEDGPDPGRELAGMERLGDEVVGPVVEAGGHGGGSGLLVDQDDRQRMALAQLLEQLQAGAFGKVHAEQQQIGVQLADLVESAHSVVRGFHAEPFAPEGERHQPGEFRLPVGDEHERPVVQGVPPRRAPA